MRKAYHGGARSGKPPGERTSERSAEVAEFPRAEAVAGHRQPDRPPAVRGRRDSRLAECDPEFVRVARRAAPAGPQEQDPGPEVAAREERPPPHLAGRVGCETEVLKSRVREVT